MIAGAKLVRMTGKLSAYLEKNARLAGAEKKEEVLALFDKMHQLFPYWVIMTCPVMHPEINYISKHYAQVFGLEDGYRLNHDFEHYFTYVHEADQEDLFNCFNFVHDFLESVLPELHPSYRAVLHYRLRKKNGQYMYVHDEKAVLDLRDGGNLYYGLLRDITTEKKFSGVKIELFKQEGSVEKIMEYKPSAERNTLTKREGELVTLIKQGLSTKEIAWYLKISHNTVRNIKSKLFEKFKVNNTIELLNMTA